MDEYSRQLHKACTSLLKFMAVNLGLETERISSLFEDGGQGMRMNYYPPCPQADKVIGLAPHHDATGLTLLVQVNEVQGLQIKKNSKWLPVYAVPGAIIVNTGAVLEILSNGEYISIEHRAVVDFQKERLSIAAFHGPSTNAKIGPLPDLLKENEANYKSVEQKEFNRLVVSSKIDVKSVLEEMRISK